MNNKETPKLQNATNKLRTIVRTNIRYNISVRLISFVILVALLSGGIVGMVMLKNSRDYLRQQALQSNLNQANLASSYASNYIKAIEAHITVFATRPDVRQAVLNGTTQQLQPTLAEFVQIQTPLNGVGIYDTNGIQLTFSLAGSTTIGQSFSNLDWYQGLMAADKPYLGLPTLAKSNNVPVETFAVPILDDQGQIRAILTGGISLQSLSDALVNIGFSSGTIASMIDTRNGGLIIADNDPSLLLTTVSRDNEAISRLVSGQSGVIETTDNKGGSNLIGFAPVADLPWGVMIVTPGSTAFAILNTLTQRAILFGGLILLAACILGVFLLLGIIRPLQHLVQETKEIGGGNLDLKVEIGGNDEIGDLSRSFSDMTAKLKNTMVSRDELTAEVIERKLAEQNLQSLTTYQGELLAAIPDIVMEVDNNKIYSWANQAGLEFFGDDVIGKEASFYFEGEQDTYNAVKPLFSGEENTFYVESWQRRKDGQKRLLAWWCRVLKDNRGNVTGALSSAQDITERRRMEEEKEKFTKELAEKNTELERFTYTVSHDLKSPLVTIKTFLGYLKQDITDTDAGRIEKDMSFMNGAADKMEKLLGELLEMSRVGRIINPPEKVTFGELVKEAMGIVAGSIADGGVKVQVSDELVTLYGDRSRLVEIWQNLVENAVKFIGDQASPSIDIGIERHDRETVFFVRDNGIGINPKYQSKLFNLFEKINPRTEGTGMGLAITKRIVELYRGRIWVESKGEGQGSCFFFTLPGALKEMGKGVRT